MLEKITGIQYPLNMEMTSGALGIMADSHGRNGLLRRAVETLESLGAATLIHLGDLCDSLVPQTAEEALRILSGHRVLAVRGNNECTVLHDRQKTAGDTADDEVLASLERLPYCLAIGPFLFTHSAPYPFPAATKRPLPEFLPGLAADPSLPFSILFRGHSHRPSILEIEGRSYRKIPHGRDRDIQLEKGRRYIVTAGAVEASVAALFDPERYLLRFVTVPDCPPTDRR